MAEVTQDFHNLKGGGAVQTRADLVHEEDILGAAHHFTCSECRLGVQLLVLGIAPLSSLTRKSYLGSIFFRLRAQEAASFCSTLACGLLVLWRCIQTPYMSYSAVEVHATGIMIVVLKLHGLQTCSMCMPS